MTTIDLTPAQFEFLKSSISGFSEESWKIELAGQAGSQRRFLRVSRKNSPAESFVLVIWDSHDEDWERFLAIQKDLKSLVPFLPEIFNTDPRHGLILEEDLGTVTLKKYCIEHRDDLRSIETMYCRVLDALCKWQSLDTACSAILSSRAMDFETFLWESDYFARHCVSEYCGCDQLLNTQWEKERRKLAIEAAGLRRSYIHRDFQSENIMIVNGKVRFVDYQGARLGPPHYDTASLLFDPYIDLLDSTMSQRLYEHYLTCSPFFEDARRSFHICACQRLMQALGAYGNLSIHKGKSWYREFIPLALERLQSITTELPEFAQTGKIVANCCHACQNS